MRLSARAGAPDGRARSATNARSVPPAPVEVEELGQVADRAQSVAGRRGRAVRVVAGARRGRVVEGVVARGERRQAVQALDELERRDVLGGPAGRGDAAAAPPRGGHPPRDAGAEGGRGGPPRGAGGEESAPRGVGGDEN